MLRRPLAVVLSALIVFPPPALSRVLDPIDLPTAVVRVVPAFVDNPKGEASVTKTAFVAAPVGTADAPSTDTSDGLIAVQASPGACLRPASPALDASPRFHGGSGVLTAWGLGWSSDLDHRLIIESTSTMVWLDGDANRVRLFRESSKADVPQIYNSPVTIFSRLTVTALQQGRPSMAALRDRDGTTRTFTRAVSTDTLFLSSLTDRNGNVVTYIRDPQERLTRVQDVHGRFLNIEYDANGFVSQVTDSGGRNFTHTYDASGRRLTENGPDGETTYEYDAGGRISRVTYPDDGMKNFTYDAQGRVLTEDDGSGVNLRTYEYLGDRTSVTDAAGGVTVTEFVTRDGLRKPVRVVAPGGAITLYAYDAAFNLATVTDPLGRISRYTYDARGNVTVAQDPAGGFTRATYEPQFGMPTKLTSPRELDSILLYDGRGNLTSLTDPRGRTTFKTYDGFGHLASDEDPTGRTTQFTYHPANGALATVRDPNGRVTTLITDALSRVTRSIDPTGAGTDYAYDASGNLTRVTDALGGVTAYSYEPGRPAKRLATLTDARNRVTSFGYDANGRLDLVRNALGQQRTSLYDAAGRLTRTTNARGQIINYTYDPAGRLATLSAPGGAISRAYDAAGNLTSISNQNGSVNLTYDALNRVIQVAQTVLPDAPVIISYGYDADGNRTSMSAPWGATSYVYDAAGRLTTLNAPQGAFAFEYDDAGRRTRLLYPNGNETRYTYDAAGQVTSIIHRKASSGPILARADYAYDAAGNRLSLSDLQGAHSFAYDDLHRLTSALHPSTYTPTQAETFAYDAVGNRLADAHITGYTYDSANRLTQNSSYTYTYDADGNLTSRTDRATSLTTTFAYDAFNRLTGASLPTGVNWTYKYDALGRRVQKSSGTLSSQVTRFIYDDLDIAATRNGAGALKAGFTHGPGVDEPLAMAKGGVSRYMLADALGSVVAHSGQDGELEERVDYTAYGQARFTDLRGPTPLSSSASFTGSPFAFTGRELDEETGLYFHRARQTYDPHTGRFGQEDPIGVAGGVNLYAYVEGRPTKFADPMGLVLDDPGAVLRFANNGFLTGNTATAPFSPDCPPSVITCSNYRKAARRSSNIVDLAIYDRSNFVCSQLSRESPYQNCVRQCLLSNFPVEFNGVGTIPVLSSLIYLGPVHAGCFAQCVGRK